MQYKTPIACFLNSPKGLENFASMSLLIIESGVKEVYFDGFLEHISYRFGVGYNSIVYLNFWTHGNGIEWGSEDDFYAKGMLCLNFEKDILTIQNDFSISCQVSRIIKELKL